MTGDRSRIPDETTDPALCAAEARVFARAALRLLDEGECEAAANLFYRAFEFAGRAA
jgi:hypothetical protein